SGHGTSPRRPAGEPACRNGTREPPPQQRFGSLPSRASAAARGRNGSCEVALGGGGKARPARRVSVPRRREGPVAEAAREPENLEQLLERIEQADDDAGGRVSVGALLDAVGHRSFGAILLAAGLFTVLPGPADIPGVPTLVGVLVLLVSGQILLRQDHV